MATLSSDSPIEATLRPDYRLSLSTLFIGLCVASIQAWIGLVVAFLGLFLVIQTTLIRLIFTETELRVCRGNAILRQFPYADWQAWTIFWAPVPILFYFREIKSIHFLPMLFSASELMEQLNQHCGDAGLTQ
ncbi:MAG: DUF3119 family protein [Leptolyngbya sp. SIO3F4]|nr:DUF3119 family protein [Leptolyngbya sp. SIO3F4]